MLDTLQCSTNLNAIGRIESIIINFLEQLALQPPPGAPIAHGRDNKVESGNNANPRRKKVQLEIANRAKPPFTKLLRRLEMHYNFH